MKSLIQISLLVISTVMPICFAHAGYEVGNGGQAVVCRDEKKNVRWAELLDVFELRQEMGLPEQEFEALFFKPAEWLEILHQKSPRRAALYRDYIQDFDAEAVFLNEKLPPTNDTGEYSFLPWACSLEQLIVQDVNAHPVESSLFKGRYKIAKPLWEKLSPLNKAAGQLHEAAYRERIRQCIDLQEGKCFPHHFSLNSVGVRKLVGAIISGSLATRDPAQINELFLDAGFRR